MSEFQLLEIGDEMVVCAMTGGQASDGETNDLWTWRGTVRRVSPHEAMTMGGLARLHDIAKRARTTANSSISGTRVMSATDVTCGTGEIVGFGGDAPTADFSKARVLWDDGEESTEAMEDLRVLPD